MKEMNKASILLVESLGEIYSDVLPYDTSSSFI